MERSEQIIEIAKALTAFQSEIENVAKKAANPFFKSKYATLDSIWDTVRPVLSKHGLSLSQFPTGKNELSSILMHESGQFLQSTVEISPKENTPQAIGSAITYMRRYSMSAILGIATEEDDDGNAASTNPAPKAPKPVAKPPVKVPTMLQKKSRITQLMQELGHTLKEMDKDEANATIEKIAGLVPDETNLDEIVSRLTVLISEKNEANKK